jgi:hypothetical protein
LAAALDRARGRSYNEPYGTAAEERPLSLPP